MAVDYADFEYLFAKRNVVDKARVLFSNVLDTSKNLNALYELPEVTSLSSTGKVGRNPYGLLIYNSEATESYDFVHYKISDSDITKAYIRCVLRTNKNVAIGLSDGTSNNYVVVVIYTAASTQDFLVYVVKNGSGTSMYAEGIDLNNDTNYDCELVIDFDHDTFAVFRDDTYRVIGDLGGMSNTGIQYLLFRNYGDGTYSHFLMPLVVSWEV